MRAFLLALPLAIAGCSAAESGRVDPVLAALVPADTIMLSGIHMTELRSTPLYTKLIAQKRLSELDDFARETHFDLRKDVNEVLVISNGSKNLALARGNFKTLAPPGVKKSAYKGFTVYGSDDGAFAILDPTTAVAGTGAAVRGAIDQKQSGQRGASPLLDRARGIPAAGQLWLVSNGWGKWPDELSQQNGNISNMGRFLRSIERATAFADLRSGFVASVNGECKTEQDAKSLGDAARGMVGMGRLSVPENQPQMLRVFDGIKVDQKQRSIQVNVNISPDLLDRMIQMTAK